MTPIHNVMVSDLVGSLCWWTRMVSMTAWRGPDRQLDKRTYTERGMRVGERAHRADRRRGAIRSTCRIEDTPKLLYANRRNGGCMAGLRRHVWRLAASCASITAELNRTYPTRAASEVQHRSRGSATPDRHPGGEGRGRVWKDRESWAWREKPIFADTYVRMFGAVTPAQAALC
jgi:hypothetical protein